MSALEQIKAGFTVTDAWHSLKLPGTPGTSCKSPFRADESPSFSVYDNGHRWKDHATDKGGDVCDFVAAALKLTLSDAARWLLEQVGSRTTARNWPKVKAPTQAKPKPQEQRSPLALPALDKGTVSELSQLQRLRGFDCFAGIQMLIDRGQLAFATMRDGAESPRCWIITDSAKRNANARRLDGKPWQSLPGQPKAKTLAGSQAAWPMGAPRIHKSTMILFCEGTPDLLAAATWAAFKLFTWEAVAMPGRMRIHSEALPLFKGKQVYIFAHNDTAGLDAARTWGEQLTEAGATATALCSDTEGRDLNDALTAGESISIH